MRKVIARLIIFVGLVSQGCFSQHADDFYEVIKNDDLLGFIRLEADSKKFHTAGLTGLYENPLVYAARVKSCEVGKRLLEKEYIGEAYRSVRNEAFLESSASGNLCLLKALVSRDIDINYSMEGGNALYFALEAGRREVANYLLTLSVDIKSITGSGENMLFAAALGGNINLVNFLMSQNVDPCVKTKEGKTIVDYGKLKWGVESEKVRMLEGIWGKCNMDKSAN